MSTKDISPNKWEWVKAFFDSVGIQTSGAVKQLLFDTTASLPAWALGQHSYDPTTKTHILDTGVAGVRVNVGQEQMRLVYNDTGSTILNGTPCSHSGGAVVDNLLSIIPTDADNIQHALEYMGIATNDILDGESGFVTLCGGVNGIDTSTLSVGAVYVASGGGLTNTLPLFPTNRVHVGCVSNVSATEGIICVNSYRLRRNSLIKSYSFTSQGVGAGSYWKAGFYDWATTSIALTQASPSTSHGVTGVGKAAHVGVVPSAAGIVDTGQVGLRVTGIEDSESGIQVAAQTAIITEDITTLTLNTMAETSEKFSGEVVIELYVVSGTPTAYSLTFNYGFSKYEDFGNQNITVVGLEAVLRGAATPADSDFDILLYHHKSDGWTYAATGFEAGDSVIAQKSVDQALAGSVLTNEDSAWKRVGLSTYVEGSGSEGVLFKVITGANNTIQTMDMHIGVVSEEVV